MNKSTLAKISGIFSILFVAFSMTANASQVTINVAEGVMTYDGNAEGSASLQDVKLTADEYAAIKTFVITGTYGAEAQVESYLSKFAIETLDLSNAKLPNFYKFQDLTHLKNVIWPTTGTFIIPGSAFRTSTSNWKTVTIPSNCTEIQEEAFALQPFETITITGPSTILRARAFDNVKTVKDVYVVSGEETYEGTDWNGNPCTKYYCETGAFDFWVTWVQTQVKRINEAATLHIPSTASNLDNFRIPNVDVLTQEVLSNLYHGDQVNGWREFIKNSNAIVATNQVFRTFSDTKEHKFPKCEDINQGIMIYYVVGVTNDNKILLEPLNASDEYVLPANTGVLVYTKKGFVIYNSDQNTNLPAIGQYGAKTPLTNTNYLESLQDAPETGATLCWKTSYNGVTYVNMFLNNRESSDATPSAWGFYGIYKKHYDKSEIDYRAYLRMPFDKLSDTSIYGFYDGKNDVPPTLNNGKIFDLDIDDLDNETTMIVTTKIDNDQISFDDSYYNISGQKINEPANGLYIHAGKKYMK